MFIHENISHIESVTETYGTGFSLDFFAVNDTDNTYIIPNNYNSSPISSSSQQSIIRHYKDLLENNQDDISTSKSLSKSTILKSNSLVKDIRNALDRPLAGLIVIGSLFLTISILMALVVFVFYKKRNTVFIYEKSQHGGLYSPGERSMVIGQTKQARKICRRNDSFNSYNNADVEDDDDLSFTNTDENDTEIEFQYHGKASYVVRPEYGIFQNSQCIQKLSTNIQKPPESHCLNEPLETENHVAVAINNANKPFEQPLGPHQHYLSIYSGNISSNPRFLLCPKHAYLISSQNKSNQIIE